VEALATTFQKTPHRGIRAQGLHELDGSDEEYSDPLGRQLFRGGTGIPSHELEKRTSLLEGGDSHGDVVERV